MSGRDRRSWLLAGSLGVVLLGGIGLMLATRPSEDTRPGAAGPAVEPMAVAPVGSPPGVPQRTADERLALAFSAVFGRASPIRRQIEESAGVESALRVVDMPFGPVLLTEARIPDGCHVCLGYMGVYYLRETPTGFEVVRRFQDSIEGNGFGYPPLNWRMTDQFTRYPAVYNDNGTLFQGEETGGMQVTELTPDGPVSSGALLRVDNSAAGYAGGNTLTLDGSLRNIVRARSFEVHFTGTCDIVHRYVMRGGKFELAEDVPLECPDTGSGKGSEQ